MPNQSRSLVAHTPGPWVVDKETNVYCDDDVGSIVAQCSGFPGRLIPLSKETEQANTHLISASPEMLDALKQFTSASISGDEVELANAFQSAELAIAKAEGRDE